MVRKDTVQTTVIVNGKQGINELGKLEMEANELQGAIGYTMMELAMEAVREVKN